MPFPDIVLNKQLLYYYYPVVACGFGTRFHLLLGGVSYCHCAKYPASFRYGKERMEILFGGKAVWFIFLVRASFYMYPAVAKRQSFGCKLKESGRN